MLCVSGGGGGCVCGWPDSAAPGSDRLSFVHLSAPDARAATRRARERAGPLLEGALGARREPWGGVRCVRGVRACALEVVEDSEVVLARSPGTQRASESARERVVFVLKGGEA